jgi:hypothetical protein
MSRTDGLRMLGSRAARLGVIALVVAGWAACSHTAHAQPPADPAAYREAKRIATATFLDRSKPVAERLAAAKGLRYPDEATFAALLGVAAATSEPDDIRLAALEHCRYDDRYVDTVLKILAEPTNGGDALKSGAVYQISQRTTFRQPAQLRQRIQSALRDRLRDPGPKTRLAAYRALVSSHDAVAIAQLVELVRRGQNLPIPLADAIDLLDIDGPTKHIVTVRPYLKHADPAVRAKAVKVLASDRESRPAIVKLVNDPNTPQVVRTDGLRALAREDENFDYAIDLLQNPRESAEIRYSAMKAYAGRMNFQAVPPASQVRFAEAVEKVSTQRGMRALDGNDVGDEAGKLLEALKKSFPAVKRHFARP